MEYTNTEMDAAIADVIHSERDRRLMRRRMIDGIKFEPLLRRRRILPPWQRGRPPARNDGRCSGRADQTRAGAHHAQNGAGLTPCDISCDF